jgi:hypothetical protein
MIDGVVDKSELAFTQVWVWRDSECYVVCAQT